jgi:predicted LPLAT superfamily acyltransferase
MSQSTVHRSIGARPAMEAADMQERWGAPRCGYRANAAMLWIGTRILPLGYGLVWLAAIYFLLFCPRARRASGRYMALVAGGRLGVIVRSWRVYRHMVAYGFLLLDRALMLARAGHGFAIDCEGLLHLTRAPTSEEEGVIVLSAHFGMAEISAPYMRKVGMRRGLNIVMYQDTKDGTERFHTQYRKLLEGTNVISTTDPLAAGMKIISALKRGEMVAMRADRTMSGKGVAVTLLGERLVLPAGPFMAAVLSGAPVVYIDTVRMGYRRYRCAIASGGRYGEDEGGTREERIERAAQDFAAHLEGMLRRYPRQWGNFYDLWAVQRVDVQALA